jgi:hypothetical protein
MQEHTSGASMPQIPITVLFNHYKATKNTSKKGCAHHHGSSGQSELRKSGQPPGKHEKKPALECLTPSEKKKNNHQKISAPRNKRKKRKGERKKCRGIGLKL